MNDIRTDVQQMKDSNKSAWGWMGSMTLCIILLIVSSTYTHLPLIVLCSIAWFICLIGWVKAMKKTRDLTYIVQENTKHIYKEMFDGA